MAPKATGRFFDGKSAAGHDVTIEASGSYLNIIGTDGRVVKRWTFNELQILEDAHPPIPAKLGSKREPDARLQIEADENWKRLKEKIPRSAHSKQLPTGFIHFLGYGSFALVVIILAIFYIPKMFEFGGNFLPRSVETKLGRMVISSLVREPVCVSSKGQAALEKIIRNLQGGTKSEVNYNIIVVQNPDIVNALAAPGGFLVLFSGALDKMGNADEVAGVLAHEMAHAELRHPAKALVRDIGFALMVQAMLGGGGDTAKIVSMLNQLRYSRMDETEADDVGQKMLHDAGYDAAYMVKFFERLHEEEIGKTREYEMEYSDQLVYLSTHPLTSDRIVRLQKNAEKMKNQKPKTLLTNSEWSSLKNICSETREYTEGKK
jgi:Zn-dependent protease with chaperone function